MDLDRYKSDLDASINVPTSHSPLLTKCVEAVNAHEELNTLWAIINVNAIDRLNMSDHGPIHFQIVANIALKLTRMLKKAGVEMSVQKHFGLSYEHAEIIVFLGSVMHDLGMTVNREGHEEFSLVLADRLLHEILTFLPLKEQIIVKSEVLHSIISHRKGGTPYTLEAGIVRVADALDMNEGRSRISYERGSLNIYSLSDMSIEKIDILSGETKPIQINITMINSAGLFQVDELLKKKLAGSKLEPYISVKAEVATSTEKKMFDEFLIA